MRSTRASLVLLVTCVLFREGQARWVVDDFGCNALNGDPGACLNLYECEEVASLIRDSPSENVKDILKPHACGVEGEETKVCCAFPTVVSTEETVDHSRHKNVNYLPQNCGKVHAWGIFDGNETRLGEFGWAALLNYRKPGDPNICGGTLINDRYVLTAARCVRNKYRLAGIRLGEHDVRTYPDCTWEYSAEDKTKICAPPHQNFEVSPDDAVVHPRYDPVTLENDIALVRLRKKADLNADSVAPICLPITKKEKEQRYSKYTAIGWGATEFGVYNPILLKVLTTEVNSTVCTTFYKEIKNFGDKKLCTLGVQGLDSCAGDYGGSLMGYYPSGITLKTIQYGIVSRRLPKCENSDVPTIYTDVASYVGWILDNIKP